MKFYKKLLFIFFGVIIYSLNCKAAIETSYGTDNDKDTLKGKKVLYVYGGWDGHEPEQCRDIFVPWLKSEGAEVFVFDNLSCYTDSVLMKSINLIIQHFTQGVISPEQERALLNTVKRGVGLAGWHRGTGDSFRMNVEFQYMVGGQWVAHPGNVIPYKVNIVNTKDKITSGLKDFNMKS